MRATRLTVVLAALGIVAGATVAVAAPATVARPSAGPARFRVGVATVNIDPTYPVYMGGYGGGPAGGTLARHVDPLTGRTEHFTVRAMAIGNGHSVVELARVDSQGWFAGYQEGPYGISNVRQAVARFLAGHGAPGATEADIIVSTLHEHAAPTIMGIWGPPSHALPYLESVAAATTRALEQAWTNARPATLAWGSVDASFLTTTGIANANANEGWPVDGALLALWARDAATGTTIGTYVIQPGYPNIVYGPGDIACPNGTSAALLSTDFPSYTANWIESRLGGTALIADGTLGDSPGPMQVDNAPSRDLPNVAVTSNGKTVSCKQTIGFDDAIHMGAVEGQLVMTALGHAHAITNGTVAAAEQYVVTPGYNPELLALDDVAPLDGGQVWSKAGGNSLAYPIDRSAWAPYGYAGTAGIGTWVTGLRIGGLLLLSEPGEFFPSIHQAWDSSITGADGVFAIGMGQDQLGYDYPVYAYPFTYYSADENTFNPSLTLGDQVVTAGQQDAAALGFGANYTVTAEATARNDDFARVFKPGVQIIPFPQAGDLGTGAGGSFDPLLQGFESQQRFSAASACNPPVLPSVSPCPLGPSPTMGPYHWNFGDGTAAVTPANNLNYFPHRYARPGVYQVTVTATQSDGQVATARLPITVFPALRVSVVTAHGRETARVQGGSGSVLLIEWVLPDHDVVTGASVPAGLHPLYCVVTDSTGTQATARA